MKTPPRGWIAPTALAPTRTILLRHGQTEDSVHRLFSGSGGTDPALTEEGHAQARQAAEQLVGIAHMQHISAIISSPLQRAQQTADYAAQRLGVLVATDPLLRECDFGQWEGRTLEEITADDPRALQRWVEDLSVAPPGGESLAAVVDRLTEFRRKTVTQWSGESVVIVSHVTPIKALLRDGLGAADAVFQRVFLDLASLSVVDFYPDGEATVRLVNHVGRP